DVELASDGQQILVLGLPVRAEGREVFQLQHGVRVAEALPRDRVRVLGAHGEQHAALTDPLAVLLEGGERLRLRGLLPDPDAIDAVIPDDAAPERVVEVEDQALAAPAIDGSEDGCYRPRELEAPLRSGDDLVLEPTPRVEVAVEAHHRRHAGLIVDEEARLAARLGRERLVHALAEADATRRVHGVQVAENTSVRGLEVVLYDDGGGVLEDRLPDLLVPGQLLRQRRLEL